MANPVDAVTLPRLHRTEMHTNHAGKTTGS
jgi:hypothetical protein